MVNQKIICPVCGHENEKPAFRCKMCDNDLKDYQKSSNSPLIQELNSIEVLNEEQIEEIVDLDTFKKKKVDEINSEDIQSIIDIDEYTSELVIDKIKEIESKDDLFICRGCGKIIRKNNDNCPYCGDEVEEEDEEKHEKDISEDDQVDDEEKLFVCTECGAFISEDKDECPYCGSTFERGHVSEDKVDGPEVPKTEHGSSVKETEEEKPLDEKFMVCDECGMVCKKGQTVCPDCGNSEFLDINEPELDEDIKNNIEEGDGEINLDMCPICGHFIAEDKERCPICGSTKSTSSDIEITDDEEAIEEDKKIFMCDACGAFVKEEHVNCPICGSSLDKAKIDIQEYEEEEVLSDSEVKDGIIYSSVEMERDDPFKICKKCGAVAEIGADRCPICNSDDFEIPESEEEITKSTGLSPEEEDVEKDDEIDESPDQISKLIDDIEKEMEMEKVESKEKVEGSAKEGTAGEVEQELEEEIAIPSEEEIEAEVEELLEEESEGPVEEEIGSRKKEQPEKESSLEGIEEDSEELDEVKEEVRPGSIEQSSDKSNQDELELIEEIDNILIKENKKETEPQGTDLTFDYFKILSAKEEDKIELVRILELVGNIFVSVDRPLLALEKFREGLELLKEIDCDELLSTLHVDIARLNFILGYYERSLNIYKRALNISDDVGDRKKKANIMNNIGSVYKAMADHNQALGWYTRALKESYFISDRKGIAICLNNIGTVYHIMGQHEIALKRIKQALVIEDADIQTKIKRLNDIGSIYCHNGDYKKALIFYKRLFRINWELDNKVESARILRKIGRIYRKIGKYRFSLISFLKSLDIINY